MTNFHFICQIMNTIAEDIDFVNDVEMRISQNVITMSELLNDYRTALLFKDTNRGSQILLQAYIFFLTLGL